MINAKIITSKHKINMYVVYAYMYVSIVTINNCPCLDIISLSMSSSFWNTSQVRSSQEIQSPEVQSIPPLVGKVELTVLV